MLKIHCQGCDEEELVSEKKPEIKAVTLTVIDDSRSWSNNPDFKADLCPTCVERLLRIYFGIVPDADLKVEEIMPQSLRVAE